MHTLLIVVIIIWVLVSCSIIYSLCAITGMEDDELEKMGVRRS